MRAATFSEVTEIEQQQVVSLAQECDSRKYVALVGWIAVQGNDRLYRWCLFLGNKPTPQGNVVFCHERDLLIVKSEIFRRDSGYNLSWFDGNIKAPERGKDKKDDNDSQGKHLSPQTLSIHRFYKA